LIDLFKPLNIYKGLYEDVKQERFLARYSLFMRSQSKHQSLKSVNRDTYILSILHQ